MKKISIIVGFFKVNLKWKRRKNIYEFTMSNRKDIVKWLQECITSFLVKNGQKFKYRYEKKKQFYIEINKDMFFDFYIGIYCYSQQKHGYCQQQFWENNKNLIICIRRQAFMWIFKSKNSLIQYRKGNSTMWKFFFNKISLNFLMITRDNSISY